MLFICSLGLFVSLYVQCCLLISFQVYYEHGFVLSNICFRCVNYVQNFDTLFMIYFMDNALVGLVLLTCNMFFGYALAKHILVIFICFMDIALVELVFMSYDLVFR